MSITQTITPLPSPPNASTDENAVFSAKADASLVAQVAMVGELNTLTGQMNVLAGDVTSKQGIASQAATDAAAAAASATGAANIAGTSTTSNTIPAAVGGSLSFTYVEASRLPAIGNYLLIADTAAPANFVVIRITAWNSGTKVVTGLVVDFGGSGTKTAWTISLTGKPGNVGPAAFRNRLYNGNFAINQRAVAGSVVLGAGVYGHDRWKAGASGCTYTFTGSGADTVLTITAGSLMQVIESGNIEGGVYALTNQGTAQARIAINGAATSGAYAAATGAAPLVSASSTGGQTVTVEFTTGTLDRAQLESGNSATVFERRPIGQELFLGMRCYQLPAISLAIGSVASNVQFSGQWPVPMRASPTVSYTGVAPAVTATGWTVTLTPSTSCAINSVSADL